MKKFKENWEITQNWQLIHPILGVILSMGFGYLIASRIQGIFEFNNPAKILVLIGLSILIGYAIIKLSLFFFKKLKNKWTVNARWEFIAIFIAFAVTGSTAGKLSDPLMEFIGLDREETSGWAYWPLRLFLIFPIYQVILLIFGWIFGQYKFFYDFEKKMLARMGLGFLFKK